MEFLKYAAFVGFLVTATLLINLNYKVFTKVFKNKVKSGWWIFLLMTVVPILLVLYLFSFFFN